MGDYDNLEEHIQIHHLRYQHLLNQFQVTYKVLFLVAHWSGIMFTSSAISLSNKA